MENKIEKLQVHTVIKLDLVDCLKCLFGRCIKVVTKTECLINEEQEITSQNSWSTVTIEPTTTHFIKQTKPNFGYTESKPSSKINNGD